MEFTRDSLLQALTEVGDRLYRQRKIGDVAIFGGSAMLLQFDVDFSTQDVDAVISEGHGAVMQAVQEVGRARHWNSTWLNEGVSVYLGPGALEHLAFYRSFPSEERVGLRVYAAKPAYLLALKLRALRGGSRDRDDALRLARHLDLRTRPELEAVLVAHFPDEPVEPRRRLALADLAQALA